MTQIYNIMPLQLKQFLLLSTLFSAILSSLMLQRTYHSYSVTILFIERNSLGVMPLHILKFRVNVLTSRYSTFFVSFFIDSLELNKSSHALSTLYW